MQRNARDTREIREERLRTDPEFRAYWARTALARAIANQIIGYRIKHGLTQSELAHILGMRQPAIARLESGEHNPTWETLSLLAGKLWFTLFVGIAPSDVSDPWDGPVIIEFLAMANKEQVESPAGETRSLIAVGTVDVG
jgi:transcriptional regulator with XRE-family HTH domain